jgi:hypothetical protein
MFLLLVLAIVLLKERERRSLCLGSIIERKEGYGS